MSQCSCGAPPPVLEEPIPSNSNEALNKNRIDKVFKEPVHLKKTHMQRYNRKFKRNNQYLIFLFILVAALLYIICK
tara:strand:+ start:160 stop:387 length:228 start_codon:yes stop_codon:yes gene_type:complete